MAEQQAVGGRERGGQTAGGDETRDHVRKARDFRRGEHDHVRIDHEVLQTDDAGMPAIALQAATMASQAGGVLAADLDQAQFAPGKHPGSDVFDAAADDVGVHLQLRERRVGRRREVQGGR